jgi:nitrite reductase/ring-hydroxylating ferredoxin subunit
MRRQTLRILPSNPKPSKITNFRVATVPPGSAFIVGDAAVFNVAGGFCAAQAKCTHRGGPLNEGKLDGSTVTCPWHGSQYNVCTGAVLRGFGYGAGQNVPRDRRR